MEGQWWGVWRLMSRSSCQTVSFRTHFLPRSRVSLLSSVCLLRLITLSIPHFSPLNPNLTFPPILMLILMIFSSFHRNVSRPLRHEFFLTHVSRSLPSASDLENLPSSLSMGYPFDSITLPKSGEGIPDRRRPWVMKHVRSHCGRSAQQVFSARSDLRTWRLQTIIPQYLIAHHSCSNQYDTMRSTNPAHDGIIDLNSSVCVSM